MDRLFVFNADEQVVAVLENKDGSNTCPFWEATVIEQLNGQFTFEFRTLSNHRDAAYLTGGSKIGFWDPDGAFLLFDITKPEDDHDDNLIKTVICEHSIITELNDDIVRDKRPSNVTADVALSGILTETALGGTRWSVGTVAALGTATPENIYYESPLSGVQKILKGYKTDYKPRFTISGNKITGRFIDLGPRGSDTGRRFEFTKDIKKVSRHVDMDGVKTALIGRGKGEEVGDGYGRRIDFSDVVWTTAGGKPVDKPNGQDYVGDETARLTYGLSDGLGGKRHRVGIFEDPEEEDTAVLLQKTWDHLQTINKPRITYSMTVVDLAELTGLNHQKVRLGDTVAVIDKEFKPELVVKARVIEIKRVLGEPEKTEIKLGNFIPYFTDDAVKIDEIERKLNDKAGIWDTVTSPITPGDFADTIPAAPANVTAEGIFKTVSVDWAFEIDVNIAQYEVYASKVNNFTPDTTNGSNLVYRGLSGAYVHAAATNETWYFRVRAINRNGTGGPFSPQVTASTLSIAAADITPKVITNNLIADTAAIDFAKIANVSITNAMISSITADKITSGTLSSITINGVTINGSTFNSTNAGATMSITGAKLTAVSGGFTSSLEYGHFEAKNTETGEYAKMLSNAFSIGNTGNSSIWNYESSGLMFFGNSNPNGFAFAKKVEVRGNLIVNGAGNGGELLRFNTSRPWIFKDVYDSGQGLSPTLALQTVMDNKHFKIMNSAGEDVFVAYCSTGTSYIDAPVGYKSLGKKVAWSWNGTVGLNTSVTLTHNLGYYPIVALSGNTGNLQLTYSFESLNTIKVYNFSAGGNSWSGSVHLY